MVIIKNAKTNEEIVEFDYLPENQGEQGYIKYNYKTDEVIEHKSTSYDDTLDYVGHAKASVEWFIENNKELPQEITEIWY